MLLLLDSFWCSIYEPGVRWLGVCGFVAGWFLHVGLCMVDYFREGRGCVKGDEKDDVAIRVDRGPMLDDTVAVPGRRVAMCGDPQGYSTNGCGFEQCKSGKNRLFCSEDQEQVAGVSVHCKLVTRATQLGAYSGWGQGQVKSNIFSRRNQSRLNFRRNYFLCRIIETI
ncbi:hypothetical protein [Gimesia sp.]|uniref:hypothetical protein n=1 Tax=Gimesia sp. TaxID=2024833 RepID=UPI0025BE5CDB|nr:hypothetical protein [Gimesia sp.]